MPRLSIIIVSYNACADLETCLASLVAQPPSVDREIVVVDNASTDGTPAAIRGRWPGVRLIEAGANIGFARANNLGIRQTFGELVLLLNGDTIVAPGAIDALVSVLDRRADVAVVGPRLAGRDGRGGVAFGAVVAPRTGEGRV